MKEIVGHSNKVKRGKNGKDKKNKTNLMTQLPLTSIPWYVHNLGGWRLINRTGGSIYEPPSLVSLTPTQKSWRVLGSYAKATEDAKSKPI